ncbi:hypothetical protein ACLB2K_052593 [Fragaria x ananassa]
MIEIKFGQPLLIERLFTLEDGVEKVIQFKYDGIFGCCACCGFITHAVLLKTAGGGSSVIADHMAASRANNGGFSCQYSASTESIGCSKSPTKVFRAQIPFSVPPTFTSFVSSSFAEKSFLTPEK